MHIAKKTRGPLAAALGVAIGAAVALASVTAQAGDAAGKDMEKCYGVAMKGKNDCAAGAGTTCAGTSVRDYQGTAWKHTPKGTCEKTTSPSSPTGYGQLQAFKEKPAA